MPEYRITKFGDSLHKYKRASRHLAALKEGIDKYGQEGITPVLDYDADTQINYLSLQVAHIPIDLLATVGDTVHNLSSALDCLSSRLIAEKTGNWNRRVYFPTHETLSELKRSFETHGERPCSCGQGTVIRKGSNAIIRELAPEFERFIVDEVKPCRDQNSEIWRLRKLDNINKHNTILMSVGEITTSGFNVNTREGGQFADNIIQMVAGQKLTIGRSRHPFEITSRGAYFPRLVFAHGPAANLDVLGWLEFVSNLVAGAIFDMERRFGDLVELPAGGAVVA